MVLTYEQIKAAHGKDVKTVEVPVPEWAEILGIPAADCKVLVRTFSGASRQRWDEARAKTAESKGWIPDAESLMAVLCCCDEKHKPLFSDRDIKWLTEMNDKPLSRIFDASSELNGLTPKAEAETEKNLPSSAGSGSTSPETSESSPTTSSN